MTSPAPTEHPPGATLHLGGTAWAHPDLTDQTRPLTDNDPPLTTYPGNPRRGDQDAITASIRDLGLYRTVIAQLATGRILAGNHTFRALLDLGAERVPVTWVDVDDTRAAAIVARDNHTGELGSYDDEELLALLTGDEDVLALSGYDEADLTALRGGPHSADTLADTVDAYQEQHGVIALCADPAEQQRVYDQLVALGLTVRVVSV